MQYGPFKLDKKNYYRASLKVLNFFLNLTDFELEVIVAMLKHNVHSLTTNTRVLIREHLGKDTYTFNNYIKRLKDKKALIMKDGNLTIHPNILKCIKDKEINIKFDVITDNEHNNPG